MSADNGIYIAKFPDGYRVCEAQAIDNINYFPAGSNERKQELKNYFGNSKVFELLSTAGFEAQVIESKLEQEGDYTEYGINYIGEYESFNEDEKVECKRVCFIKDCKNYNNKEKNKCEYFSNVGDCDTLFKLLYDTYRCKRIL
jgi:hypothetical protein